MTLTGTDFVSSSKVRWEGQDRDTTYLSATKLTTIINKSDLTKVGKFNITVFNPALGGGTSNAIQFEVTEKNPIPTITTISPNQKQVNSSQFTITVDGTGFIKDSVVRFAGSDRNTTYVSATNLTAVIRVADLKKEGVFKITVFNPAPGGGTSNSKDFTVTKAETAKLVINVNTTNGNDTFTFNVRGSSNSTIGVTTINANGSFTKDNIAAGSYSVEQLSKELWKLQSASCATQDGAKTGSLSQNTISGVLVQDKQTTTCSFYNIKEIPIAPISPGGDSQDEAVFFGTELIINGVVEFIQNSVENVIESAKIVAEGAVIVIDYSREVVDTPVVSVVTKVITTTGVSLATIVVVSAPGFPISEIFMTPIRLWGLLLSLLGIKKKTLPWGVVYDSQTKQPLDPAYVTLKDSSGKQVSSAITDIDGRYGFLVGSGVYTIEARKTNYAFPSKKVTGVDDEVYNNLYHGENIEIKKGEVITKNIALDPLKFDWNEFAKKNKNFMKFYSKWDMIIRKISDPSFIIGFIVSILVLVLVPKPYNMIILGCYITVLALRAVVRALGIQPKTAGYLTDKKTGNPLSFAVVRVFIPSTNTQVSQKVADKLGRYYCLVPKGRYYLKIEQKNADGSYTEVYTSPVIDASKNGIIRQRFKV